MGTYFRSFIDNLIAQIQIGEGGEKKEGGGGVSMDEVSKQFAMFTNTETNVFIRKIWLIQFHRYILANGNGSTQEIMDDLLKAESDWSTLQTVYNTLTGDEDTKQSTKKFANNLGHLYPAYLRPLMDSKSFQEYQKVLEHTSYEKAILKVQEPVKFGNEGVDAAPQVEGSISIDQAQKIDMSRRYSMAFFGQFHYGVFYAYLKLKEMEIANVIQLAELHSIGQVPKADPTWNCYVAPFQYNVDGQAEWDIKKINKLNSI